MDFSFIGAIPVWGIITPFTEAAAEDLNIAPMFLESVIPSSNKKVGMVFFKKASSINFSIFM